jgi:hypothetical protein
MKFNPYSMFSEGTALFVIAIASFVSYIPARLLHTPGTCDALSIIPVGSGQPKLAIAAIIILSALQALLMLAILRLYLRFISEKGAETNEGIDAPLKSSGTEINVQQTRNDERKLIYYGMPLVFLYVSLKILI